MGRQHPWPMAISHSIKFLFSLQFLRYETIVRTYWMTHVVEFIMLQWIFKCQASICRCAVWCVSYLFRRPNTCHGLRLELLQPAQLWVRVYVNIFSRFQSKQKASKLQGGPSCNLCGLTAFVCLITVRQSHYENTPMQYTAIFHCC